MKNNNNFSLDLVVNYLVLLMERNIKEEFNNIFSMYETDIVNYGKSTKNKEMLKKLRSIVDYKSKEVALGL